MTEPQLGVAGRMARMFIRSKLTPLILIASVAVGVVAVWKLPREEEPQIKVPMADVFVTMPAASAKEVEERVTGPMERLLKELPAAEYVYSTSSPGHSLVVVRFEVGSDEDLAILRLRDKLAAHADELPPGVSHPLIKLRSIDDVPVLAMTLSSARYDGFQLRRVAAELRKEIKTVTDVSEVKLIGGEARSVRVLVDPGQLSERGLALLSVAQALEAQNKRLPSGKFAHDNREFLVETGGVLKSAADVENVVVGAWKGRAVFVRDIATVIDGGAEPTTYVRLGAGAAAEPEVLQAAGIGALPAVTLAVGKAKGSNAIDVVDAVMTKVHASKGTLIPDDIELTVLRDYGETSAHKSNELLMHMGIAVVSVALLILFALGRREAVIVLLAIPATLALTLTVFYLYGYTLNRITLFALIFSIGILVDDAIVVVENITRHYRLPENSGRPLIETAIRAVDEVGNPTILATMTVIAAILPMAFVGGLMGPYMRPIPVGASAAMFFSLLIAFIITPWAAAKLLKRPKPSTDAMPAADEAVSAGAPDPHATKEGRGTKAYRRAMAAMLNNPRLRWSFLGGVVLLLLGAMAFLPLGLVKVKMLPFDNKSEFQVVVDMPEGTTLEQTARVTQSLADVIRKEPEVTSYQSFVGTAGPITFNGLVRHYYLREGSNAADITVKLVDKGDRDEQSHAIARRVRQKLLPVAERFDANIKVVEVPPGPPVLQTLVAEVYGPDYERQVEIADDIRKEMKQLDGVVDVDWYVEDSQPEYRFFVDEEKAALSGVGEGELTRTLRMALSGASAGLLHDEAEQEDIPIVVQLDRATRSDLGRLQGLKMIGASGAPVGVSELLRPELQGQERSIYHKNLRPVVYVTADVAGAIESPVYAMLKLGPALDAMDLPEGYVMVQHTGQQPLLTDKYSVKWDGEWHITYEVFRDLGLAFAAVMILIYVLIVAWFRSYLVPLVIMSAIPFSLVGILPAHSAMGAFFTATSMIGFIAGAGIVVRNSIILVDFIELRRREGMPLAQAVVDAGAVRFRPMVLTAAAVIVGAGVILFDPIFQGLAISLMAGEVASLFLSRVTVPIVYYMLKRREASASAARSGSEPERGGSGSGGLPGALNEADLVPAE